MDIDNLGMVRLGYFLLFFFPQGVNEAASLEEHIKYIEVFCKRGHFQGQLGIKRVPVLDCSLIGLKLHLIRVKCHRAG